MYLTLTYPVQSSGRFFTKSSVRGYRFGFQGQLIDDELYGDKLAVIYEYRIHNPLIGRFFSVDPLALKFPWNSVYAFSENRVLDGIELEGLEHAPLKGNQINAHLNSNTVTNSEMVEFAAMMTAPIAGVVVILTFPEWGPAALVLAQRFLTSPSGKYFLDRSKSAAADFLGQLAANNFEIDKVDIAGVLANYVTPFKGGSGFIKNTIIKNGIDAAIDVNSDGTYKTIFGDTEKNNSKNGREFAIEFFVGSLVDGLSGAYSEYLRTNFKNLDEKTIAAKAREWGLAAKEFIEAAIKKEMTDTSKKPENAKE